MSQGTALGGTLVREAIALGAAQPDAATAAVGRTRYGGLSMVRTLAMLSIVAYHVDLRPLLGVSFGITSLQIVLCALVARSSQAPPMGAFAAKRATRLLAPFVFWSAVYAIVEVLLALYHHQSIAGRFNLRMLAAGTSFHLWFLPWAFAVSLLVRGATSLSRGALREPAIGVAAVLGSALVYFGTSLQWSLAPGRPFYLWLDSSAAVAFGFALGRALTLPAERRRLWLCAIVACALLPCFVGPGLAPESVLWARYALALPLACIGFLLPLPESRFLERLSSYNLGVYVVHLLVVHLLTRIPAVWGLEVGWRIAAVYLLSLLGVHLLRRTGLKHVV